MRKPYFLYKLTFASLMGGVVMMGCRKENGIDNNNVLKTPYSMYVSDAAGTLYNTNTGETYKINANPAGIPMRAITTSGNNVLFVETNTHISKNNGHNFNNVESAVSKLANWQPIILDVPAHGKLYLGVDSPGQPCGIKYSTDNGATWKFETGWDAAISPGSVKATSFAQLKNGILFAHDFPNGKLYKKNDGGSNWVEVTMAGLPTGTLFFLSHINNTLVLADYSGVNGVWYSNNNGANWSQYTGLPGRPIYSVSAPFDEVLLVGTDTTGLYRLLGNTFTPYNSGLGSNTVVKGITGKEDIYKTGLQVRYYYIATNNGVYKSGNQGKDWILAKEGNYTAIY